MKKSNILQKYNLRGNNRKKLADNKLNDLPIDKEKLLYFSKIIKKRGN